MTDTENPLKASRPVPSNTDDGSATAGEKHALSLALYVDVKAGTIRSEWQPGDAEAQDQFFHMCPLAAAALVAIARGPVPPPGGFSNTEAVDDDPRRTAKLGDPEE